METLQQFTSLHKVKTSFAYRLIRISTQKDPYWKPFEIAALCIEYLQPMALLLLLQYDLNSSTNLSWLEDFIHSLAHIFDLSHLLNLDESLSTTILAVIAFCVLSLFKLIIFLYIIRAAFKADKQEGLLKTLWRIIFFFQARVLCFFISAFWFGLFASFNDFLADIPNSIKYVIAVFGCAFIIIEYSISFIGTQYFHYLLPSKHIMGTKSNIVVMMTLTQKLVLQVIRMAIPLDSNITIWAHLIVDLFSNIAKVYYFLRILPAYNSKALLLKGNLLVIAISLDLASFSYKIADILDYPVHIDFLLALWVLFSILGSQIMKSYLRQFLMDILTKPTKNQPELFIHKVYLLREFMEYKEEVNGERVSWDWKHMIKDYINQNCQGILEVESSNQDFNSQEFLDSPEIFNKLCLKYLNASLAKYPKNRLLKLYTAYYYAKRVKKQTVALRLLSELRNSADSSIRFNACLLVDDIQEILKKTYEHTGNTNNLDIYDYDRNRYGILKIKSRMIKQANIQNSLYQEMRQNSPNLGNVFEKAQSIFAYKRVIKKKVRVFLETCPDYYLRPIALLAQYNLLLNHHLPEYAEYMKRLAERHKKYEKFFHSQELCEENLYHKGTGIAFISGAKEKMGTITYASKPMLQLYGTNPVGQDIQHYMLPFLQKQTSRKGFEISEYLTSTPISPVFIYNNKSGYIIPVSNYMNIHPSIRKGLQYISFNRPLKDCKEYIILSEDNAIQAFTEGIATKLNLASLTEAHPSIGLNIESICPDFVDINKAFNLIEHPSRIDIDEKEEPLDPVKAKNLYETYSTIGNRINIKPLNTGISSQKDQKSQYSLSPKDQKPHYSFHCTITNKLYGQTFAKILELKEIKRAKKGQTPTTRGSLEEKPFSGQVNLIVPGQNTTEKLSQIHMQVPSQSVFRTYTVETEEVTSPGLHSKKPGDDSPAKREVAIVASSLNSQKSSISTHITKMKAFNAALESSYYHRMYILFIFLLVTLLITVLCSQSVMKVVVSNYADSLKTRTDVLIMAGTRNLKLMDIHRNMRYLWLYATGQQNPDDMTTEIVKIPGALSRLSSFMPDLATMNKNLRNTVNLLDSDMAQLEFAKDIRMYETIESDPDQKYINMTSFEAVDNIIADTLQIIQKVGVDLNSTAEPISIVLRNILNDMFVETENTVRLFLSSLDTDSSKNSTIIIMSLIGIVLLVVVCLGIFLAILYMQYSTEKVNMLSLTRLNVNKIIAVQQQVAKFIKMIEEEAIFEDVPLVDVTEFYYQKTSNDFTLDKAKQADDRSDPRYSRIRRKYLIFTVKITVLMACLAVFIIVNLAISQSFVENLNKKAHQVQSVNTLVEKITLSASIIIDMASENDTTTILNTPTEELLPETIQDISSGKNQVLDIYSSSNTQQADLLEPLLFENQCAQIISSLSNICWNLIQGQSSAGFIQLTTYAEFALTDYQNRFDASDRTTAALQAFQFETVNTLAPNIVIVQQLGNLVLSAVDTDLESNIETNLNKHTVILSLLCVFSVVMCVLIYDVIFLKVREADTQFRRVLQVFPANLILSNFNLKSYLIRTTHKRLDFV